MSVCVCVRASVRACVCVTSVHEQAVSAQMSTGHTSIIL